MNNYKDEYEFLSDKIDKNESVNKLADDAYDNGLNREKVLSILQKLMIDGYIIVQDAPGIYQGQGSNGKMFLKKDAKLIREAIEAYKKQE
ncbi:hypothetical protein LASUN_01140 [Lentilactobacillus sunkii]|uniref:YjcQ protein n=1 Tax=Lentilactobacillus sunkii TaxID=481719 RepID=A0A1E7XJ39_9LACO|nr:hypothetical protein [Lentilactobacillus sunkii]OFA13115.1 hypothetical protein LASUN_01140 [Lentilactobacillus sunkii]